MEKYQTYSTEDFLNDTDFIRWVKEASAEDRNAWENWLQSAPKNVAAYQQAIIILQTVLSAERLEPSQTFGASLFKDIQLSIEKEEKKQRVMRWVRIASVATAAMVTIAVGIGWYAQSMITIHTDYAQQKQIILPDNSRVTLNANSSISYHRAWTWQPKREVWVNGEVFLKVAHLNTNPAHIQSKEQFSVHAAAVLIDVLGTEFNVKERRKQVEIALLKGSIRVQTENQTTSILMKPGEMVLYNGTLQKKTLQQTKSVPQAWLEGNLIVNGLTVGEIINNFEDTYGYKVILEDSTLASKQIDGAIAFNSEETILYTLSNILNVNIYKEGKVIHLRSR